MSDFLHRAKIVELTQANSELVNEIEQLKNNIQSLNNEIERLKQDKPENNSHLKKKITEHEEREIELQEQILSLSVETPNDSPKCIFKTIVAFLAGTLVALIAWLIVDSIQNNRSYSASLKQLFNNFLAL